MKGNKKSRTDPDSPNPKKNSSGGGGAGSSIGVDKAIQMKAIEMSGKGDNTMLNLMVKKRQVRTDSIDLCENLNYPPFEEGPSMENIFGIGPSRSRSHSLDIDYLAFDPNRVMGNEVVGGVGGGRERSGSNLSNLSVVSGILGGDLESRIRGGSVGNYDDLFNNLFQSGGGGGVTDSGNRRARSGSSDSLGGGFMTGQDGLDFPFGGYGEGAVDTSYNGLDGHDLSRVQDYYSLFNHPKNKTNGNKDSIKSPSKIKKEKDKFKDVDTEKAQKKNLKKSSKGDEKGSPPLKLESTNSKSNNNNNNNNNSDNSNSMNGMMNSQTYTTDANGNTIATYDPSGMYMSGIGTSPYMTSGMAYAYSNGVSTYPYHYTTDANGNTIATYIGDMTLPGSLGVNSMGIMTGYGGGYPYNSYRNHENVHRHGDIVDQRGYVGAYSPEQRKSRIEKFHEKRSRRVWTKKVKYDVRKNFADSRLRVKGRFVKKEEENVMRQDQNAFPGI